MFLGHALGAVAAGVDGEAVNRFAARLADGELVTGEKLTGWKDTVDELKIADQAIAGERPFLWIQDRTKIAPRLSERPAHVELLQGDVIPAQVVGFARRQTLPALPEHLIVSPLATLRPSADAEDQPIRIAWRWVRRVVCERTGQPPLPPSQLRTKDGRVIAFRAIRFDADQMVALTESGRETIPWGGLSELCMPSSLSPWDLQWKQRAMLTPGGEGRMLELHTVDHLSVTASFNRLRFRTVSHHLPSESWLHGIQPVWSLDTLWVPASKVWLRMAYAPTQMPLSRISPTDYSHKPMVGVTRQWQRDRSVRQAPLLSGSGPAGWGLGVHSTTELTFTLPALARQITGRLALDASTRGRGCIVGSVLVNGAEAFRSKHLIGAAAAEFSVPLGKPDRASSQTVELKLKVDAAHDGRPAGADPFDIRDQSNWLDPMVELDPAEVKQRCDQLRPESVPAWEGWTFWSPGSVRWQNEWDELAPAPGAFLTRLFAEQPVQLARLIQRRPSQKFLVLAVSNQSTQEPALLEVHSGGRLLLRRSLPLRSSRRPVMPLTVVSLESLPLGEVADLVVTAHGAEPMALHWQAVQIAESHPEYTSLFDDQEHDQAIEGRDQAFVGARCYRIVPGKPLRHVFRETMQFRYRPEPGQSRYIRFAVSTPTKGMLTLRVKVRGEDQSYLYDVGQGPQTEERALRIVSLAVSEDWLAVLRDLCRYLRDADVEWIEFFVPPEMGEVWLDQAYVGRGGGAAVNDLATPLEKTWHSPKERTARVDQFRKTIGPSVLTLQFEDGRLAEGVVLDDKHVLTVGACVPKGGKVRITSAESKQFDGVIRGVSRTNNWAVIESISEERLPGSPRRFDGGRSLQFNEIMIECGVGGKQAAWIVPAPTASRRIWRRAEEGDIEGAPAGRPLVTAAGQVAGLRRTAGSNRDTRYDACYVSLFEFSSQFAQLKKEERTGAWLLGEGPTLGLSLQWTEDGAKVLSVNRAAEASGIQVGDILERIEGQTVRDAWTAHFAFREKDPGDEVTVDLRRNEEQKALRLRLQYR